MEKASADMPIMCTSTYVSDSSTTPLGTSSWQSLTELGGLTTTQVQEHLNEEEENMEEGKVNKRVVRIFIVDPDDNVSIGDSLIYKSDEKLTDLTNTELYYEINLKELLSEHNENRVKTVDKKASNKFGRDIYLEPAKIRDLVMTVVEIAKF